MRRRIAIKTVMEIYAKTAALEKRMTDLSSRMATCGVIGRMQAMRCHLHKRSIFDNTRKAAQVVGDI